MSAQVVKATAPWVERMQVANKMLAEAAGDPQRASRVWDFAEAARVYAIQLNLGIDAINHAVAVKLKSQRLLANAVDAGQAKGEIASRGNQSQTLPAVTFDELGLYPKRVHESRKIRDAFTDEAIDTAAREASEAGEELTSAEMLSRAREHSAKPREDYLSGDGRVRKARFLHSFAGALPTVFTFDPVEVAEAADEDLAETIRSSARQYADWVARFDKARSGLRVVSGGKK